MFHSSSLFPMLPFNLFTTHFCAGSSGWHLKSTTKLQKVNNLLTDNAKKMITGSFQCPPSEQVAAPAKAVTPEQRASVNAGGFSQCELRTQNLELCIIIAIARKIQYISIFHVSGLFKCSLHYEIIMKDVYFIKCQHRYGKLPPPIETTERWHLNGNTRLMWSC